MQSINHNYREELKQDGDLDDPWIMTVKGNMKLSLEEVPPLNHKNSTKISNGSQLPNNSPAIDSNLNHYRGEKQIAVSKIKNHKFRYKMTHQQMKFLV